MGCSPIIAIQHRLCSKKLINKAVTPATLWTFRNESSTHYFHIFVVDVNYVKLWFPIRSSIQYTTHSIAMKLHLTIAVADYVGPGRIFAVISTKQGFTTAQSISFPCLVIVFEAITKENIFLTLLLGVYKLVIDCPNSIRTNGNFDNTTSDLETRQEIMIPILTLGIKDWPNFSCIKYL